MAGTRRMNHEGSIVKKVRDGKVRYEFRQMIDGVKRCATAQTMEELAVKIKTLKGTSGTTGKIRVSDWNSKWLEVYVKPLKRQATYDQYMYMVRHIDAVIGKRYMRGITPSDIQLVIAKANSNGAATSTMKHIRKVASCSFNRAVTDGIVNVSPVKNIEIPLKQAKKRKTFTPLEVGQLIEGLRDSRWLPSLLFAMETGMRKGELLALKWSDIDVKGRIVTIDESLARDATAGDTKGAKEHDIPLSKKAMLALDMQRNMLLKEGNKAIHRKASDAKAWVFPNQRGEALRPSSYYDVISRAGEKYGFTASPHMLRHTFVRNSRGLLDLKDLQHILGHDESTTTLDIYGDILNDKNDEMASALDTASEKFDADVQDAMKAEELKRKNEARRVVAFPG